MSGPSHTQEGARSALSDSTTRRDDRRRFPQPPFRAAHARHVVEIRSGKNGRLFPQEHEWGCRASARSDRARRKRSRLPTWLFRAGVQHVLWHVVQKVRSHIKFGRIATLRRSLLPRFDGCCCAPPCTSGLAGSWDHRVDKHNRPHGRTRANKGYRKAR